MDYQFKSYSQGNKKKSLPVYFILVPFGIWIAYMIWSISLGQRVVMFEWFPKWTISITFAAFVGLIGGIWSIFRRPTKLVFKNFLSAGFAGFILIVPVFDVLTYLLSEKTIHYQTEYEITSPGPSTSRFSRCEHGIWIKEVYTDRWALLCINNAKLETRKGADTVWVTTKTGLIGSYIVDYQFSPPNP
ncbi:hypothetical protein KKJ09_15230 [Xenorhabdus bovienii]|uniref:hypothetical protein n=1 Tax=Xenorhabdus bovienii TaxID=40576 RepID=UPI0023B2DC5D|nr:hypothetical protein [Xenorhabdus bovienii]MDE9494896.1 hypothetical protein [Xenorhabdus bovienii]MDE9503224.1 hypothetical protein [Xenorhabdus bovienii]MDE9527092.1 hypothetical protein [Xenorhabdus bovienii]MDE9570187.1 hypothetical protein [Xenorhabdus bovienii]